MAAGTVLGRGTEDINAYLRRLKQLKIGTGQLDQNGQPVKPDWQDFTPTQLAYQKPADNGIFQSANNAIAERDDQVTQTALTKAANRQNQAIYKQQQQQLKTAQQGYTSKLSAQQVEDAAGTNTGATQSIIPPPGGVRPPSGAAPQPGSMTTIVSHGHSVTVNSSVATRFQSFLDALWKSGYHFKSVSGYANRDIHTGPAAGKGVQSLHALGYAIDIDPTSNPTSPIKKSGQYVYSLPPSVGALASKYGLSWGGNWHSYKDFMHFSVPYGGRE